MKVASIILACISAILGLFAKIKWKELPSIGKASLIAGIIATIAATVVTCQEYNDDQRQKNIESSFGGIEDPNKVTFPIFRVGRKGPSFRTDDGVFYFEGIYPSLKVYSIGDKVSVSATIRDFDGKPIARIDKNEWTMYKKSEFEYNNDLTGFEVVSIGDRKVYFQLDFIEGVAVISGLFLNEFKNGGYLFYDSVANGAELIGIEAVASIPDIPLIFKYPREKYYGVRQTY